MFFLLSTSHNPNTLNSSKYCLLNLNNSIYQEKAVQEELQRVIECDKVLIVGFIRTNFAAFCKIRASHTACLISQPFLLPYRTLITIPECVMLRAIVIPRNAAAI